MSLIKTQAIVLGKTLETKSIIKGDNHLGIQFNKILTLANSQYNIHRRKFKIYYNAIFLNPVTYAFQIFADEYKKVRIRRKTLTI